MHFFAEHRLIYRKATDFISTSSGSAKDAVQVLQQNSRTAARVQGDSTRPVDASQNGMHSTATIKDIGPTGGYANPADAAKANQDYYTQNGASSPEIDAYQYNLENRQFGVPVSRETGAAAERAGSAYSSADKRAKARQQSRQQIIDAAKADQRRRMQNGESIDFAADESALNSQLTAFDSQQQTKDQQNFQQQSLNEQKRAGVQTPTAPMSRSQRIGLKPFGNRTSAVGVAANDAAVPPGSSATVPSGGPTPGTAPAAPGPTGLEAPGTLKGIAAEEQGVSDPVIKSLNDQEGIQKFVADQVGKLLDQRGAAADTFSSNAKTTNEQVKQDKIRQAGESMDFEMDLENESLVRERRDEELADEETQRQYARLEERQIADNTKEMKRVESQLGARYGGFGSGNGTRLIENARDEGEKIVREIAQERIQATKDHRNKLADLEKNHKLAVRGIIQNHDTAVTTAMDDALNKALAIDEDKLASDEEKLDKTAELIRTTGDKISTIRQQTGTELSKANRATLDRRDALRAEQTQQKKDGLDLLKWHIATYGDSNPDGLTGIIQQLGELGIDTRGLNTSKPTLEQLNKLQSGVNSELYKPGQYRDDTGYSLGDQVLRVTSSLSTEKQATERAIGFSYLQAGDMKGYDQWRDNIARTTMDAATRKDFDAAADTLRSLSQSRGTLETLKNSNLGYWKSFIESKKPFANIQRDPQFKKLKAQVESDQSKILNQLYGAALSPQEAERANNFLVDFSTDTYDDMVTKFENMERLANDVRETRVRTQWGDFSVGTESSPVNMTPADADEWLKTLGSPQGGTAPAPASPTAMRTDRHNNPTALTTSVAKQAGLVEGVDYVRGDPFPDNPNAFTAKFLGDPINTTIRVIDKIGFYTQSGAQRWTHTAIPQAQWNAMTYDQKRAIIGQMYKREGGSSLASLFSNGNS